MSNAITVLRLSKYIDKQATEIKEKDAELLALRAQVARQKATIEEAIKTIDEKDPSRKATRKMLCAALAQIESEEVGR